MTKIDLEAWMDEYSRMINLIMDGDYQSYIPDLDSSVVMMSKVVGAYETIRDIKEIIQGAEDSPLKAEISACLEQYHDV